jgi:hypothetical protein
MTTGTRPDSARPKKKGRTAALRKSGKQAALGILGEESYFTLRLSAQRWSDTLKNKRLLIIHQMGKVGSTTINASLRAAGVRKEMSVAQTHFLSDEGRAFVRGLEVEALGGEQNLTRRDIRLRVRDDLLARTLADMRRKGDHCWVITLVRDPVAANLSGYFQQNMWWPRELREACEAGTPGCQAALQERFLSWYPHETPLRWFDMEMKPVFGIDVFSTPFDRERGFQIYEGDFATLLLIKLERLNDVGGRALSEFLRRDQLSLVQANTGGDKWYGALYDEFKRTVPLPAGYLDRMYGSPYALQFYTPEEIARFRQSWAR